MANAVGARRIQMNRRRNHRTYDNILRRGVTHLAPHLGYTGLNLPRRPGGGLATPRRARLVSVARATSATRSGSYRLGGSSGGSRRSVGTPPELSAGSERLFFLSRQRRSRRFPGGAGQVSPPASRSPDRTSHATPKKPSPNTEASALCR